MSTTITTTTQNPQTALQTRNGRRIDRCQDGTLWVTWWGVDSGSVTSALWAYSKDNGATWTVTNNSPTPGTGLAVQGAGNLSMFIDLDDNLHVAFRQSNTPAAGSNGGARTLNQLYYMRATPNAGRTSWTWSTAVALAGASGGGYDYPDIVAFRDPASAGAWVAWIVLDEVYTGGSPNQANVDVARIAITSAGVASMVGVSVTNVHSVNATPAPSALPSIDFLHTGDGKTVSGGTPHLFIAYSMPVSNGICFKKATYSAGSWTWGTTRFIDSNNSTDTALTFGPYLWLNCMYDGQGHVLIGGMGGKTGPTYELFLHERDAADTTTTLRHLAGNNATPASPANSDYLLAGSMTYDNAGNVYLFGRDNSGGNGTRSVNYRKWTRSGATLGPVVPLDTTGDDYTFASARRSYVGGRIDAVRDDNTVSPWNVVYEGIGLNQAPTAPTGLSPSGLTIDRTVTQRFSWTPTDPDVGDTQSLADLRYRLVGAGTWTDVLSAATTSSFYDFAPSALAAGSYEWQVRTYDALGVVGPYSASAFFTAASPPAAPVITAPASGGTVSTSSSVVTWSTASQEAYEVRTVADVAGSPDTSTIYQDTGIVVDSAARARSIDFAVTGRFEHVQVRTRTAGMWSTWASNRVQVSYTLPATPTVGVAAGTRTVTVSVTNPAPTGGQPTVTSWDIYRREVKAGVPQAQTRVAVGLTGTFIDRTFASRRSYQYKARAVATNGTYADSAWT